MSKQQFKTKKKLVLPVINAKMEVGTVVYFKPIEPMHVGKPQKDAKEGEKPADLMHSINLETGEEGIIIVPAVLKSVLEESYPDASYVDKCFMLEKGEKPKGKRYYQYLVEEVEEVEPV